MLDIKLLTNVCVVIIRLLLRLLLHQLEFDDAEQ